LKAQAEQRRESKSTQQALSAFSCISFVFSTSEVAYEPQHVGIYNVTNVNGRGRLAAHVCNDKGGKEREVAALPGHEQDL